MMDYNETGGPAFPGLKLTSAHGNMTSAQGSEYTPIGGMTLRDYFAAKAMYVAWEAYDKGYTGDPEDVTNSIAHHAYQIADAMLKARTA